MNEGTETQAVGTEAVVADDMVVNVTSELDGQQVAEQTEIVESKVEPVKEEPTFTQAQVQQMIQDRLAREAKRLEAEQEQAKKLAKMNATEKLQFQLKQKDEELSALKNEQNKSALRATASSLLAGEGITANEDLLGMLVSDDAETTNDNLKAFVEIANSKADELLQAKLRGTAPRVTAGVTQVAPSKSKADILAIKDVNERQKAIEENLELFQ